MYCFKFFFIKFIKLITVVQPSYNNIKKLSEMFTFVETTRCFATPTIDHISK